MIPAVAGVDAVFYGEKVFYSMLKWCNPNACNYEKANEVCTGNGACDYDGSPGIASIVASQRC